MLFKLATLSPDLPRILILQWNFSKMFLRSTAQLNKLESITKTSDENLEAIVAIKRETPWNKYSERSLNIKFKAILDILLASGRKNVLGFLFSSMELIVVFRMNVNYRIIVINTRSTYWYNSLNYRRLRQSNTYTGLTGLIHLNYPWVAGCFAYFCNSVLRFPIGDDYRRKEIYPPLTTSESPRN